MTWTFTDSATPTAKDQVRILVGDVDSTDPLISDESIGIFLTGGSLAQTNVYLAAAMVADRIAATLARGVQSVSAGGSSVVFDIASARAKYFRDLAQRLRLSGSSSAAPFCGGISRSDVLSRESDTDRVPPYFSRTSGEIPAPSEFGR